MIEGAVYFFTTAGKDEDEVILNHFESLGMRMYAERKRMAYIEVVDGKVKVHQRGRELTFVEVTDRTILQEEDQNISTIHYDCTYAEEGDVSATMEEGEVSSLFDTICESVESDCEWDGSTTLQNYSFEKRVTRSDTLRISLIADREERYDTSTGYDSLFDLEIDSLTEKEDCSDSEMLPPSLRELIDEVIGDLPEVPEWDTSLDDFDIGTIIEIIEESRYEDTTLRRLQLDGNLLFPFRDPDLLKLYVCL